MLYMLAEGRDYDQIGREFGLRGASHLIRRVTDEEQQRLAEHPLFQDLVAPSFPTNENGSVAPEGVHADEAMPPAPTQRRGRSFNTLPAASTLTDGENTSPSAYPRSHIAEIDAYEDQLSSEELREELEDELAPEEGDDILLDDSVRMYFQEIGRIPLLSAERERELAMSMQKARESKNPHNKKKNHSINKMHVLCKLVKMLEKNLLMQIYDSSSLLPRDILILA